MVLNKINGPASNMWSIRHWVLAAAAVAPTAAANRRRLLVLVELLAESPQQRAAEPTTNSGGERKRLPKEKTSFFVDSVFTWFQEAVIATGGVVVEDATPMSTDKWSSTHRLQERIVNRRPRRT